MKSKIFQPAFLLVLLATVTGCSSDDNGDDLDPAKGRITGTVLILLQDQTTIGLEGAEVAIYAADTLNTTTTSSANGEFIVNDLAPGNYEVNVSSEGYQDTSAANVIVEEGETTDLEFQLTLLEEPESIILINSGGPALSVEDEEWEADNSFEDGVTYTNAVDIANTSNPELYQTERYANNGSLTYQIPVDNGTYNVDLHFAEIFFGLPGEGSAGGEGSRVFHIDIENGQHEVDNYDIVVAAGASASAVVESFSDVIVEDGAITITLTSVVNNAKISGIEVLTP
jgi:hypothetical protein